MTLRTVAWSAFLSTSPPLPHDVKFRVVEGDQVVGELAAHRYLLATVSSVFRAQFFGNLAERPGRVIEIKETTFVAFQFLLAYLYGAETEDIFQEVVQVEQLFEIFNLAEKYDLKPLGEEIPNQLEKLMIFEENVLDFSQVAVMYKHFEVVSGQLLRNCSEFLKRMLETENDVDIFCSLYAKSTEDQKLTRQLLAMEEKETNVGDSESYLDCLGDLFETDSDVGSSQMVGQSSTTSTLPTLRPCLQNVSWLELLEPGARVPPDVKFCVYQKCLRAEDEGRLMGTVSAHKYFLSTVSRVFREMFFENNNNGDGVNVAVGNEEEGGIENVKVVCASFPAFQVMIDYMYGKYPRLRGSAEMCEIFEIIEVAEMFEIPGLEVEYRTAMFLFFRETVD